MRRAAAAAGFALCAAVVLAPAAASAQQRGGQNANAQCGVESKPPCDPRATADAAVNEVLPITPELVDELRRRYNAVGRAASGVDRPETYLTPLTPRINVGFGAGGAVPIIHTAANHTTTLSFFDNTGREWPVAWVGNSNPDEPANRLGGFHAKVVQDGANAVHISTRTPYARGSVTVQLLRAPRPVSFVLAAGTGQYVADGLIHVAGRGPNALLGVVARADNVETGGKHIGDMLDGITPAGAAELGVSGGSPDFFRAWAKDGKVYLRAQNASLIGQDQNLMSHGPDGVALYAVPEHPSGTTVMAVTDGRRNFTVFARRRPGGAASAARATAGR